MNEKIVSQPGIRATDRMQQALLYDFYGELLTEHQKEIYEQFVLEDLSLSEIAADEGISRQGVHDLIKRCHKILNSYEEKLHLVEKFLSIKENVHRIDELLNEYSAVSDKNNEEEDTKNHLIQIRSILNEIIEEL
ncbi:MAG: YlxM family DNA-binding protein [Hespellia sp.]|nr:YlxM family DNA-binding protein [Hespellia sp.]